MIGSQEKLEKVTQIVLGLETSSPSGGTENRRQRQRIAMRTTMMLIILNGTASVSVEIFTRNISSTGIGFVCRRMFRKGERVVVPLKIASIPARLVLAQIAFCRYIGGGYYEMGAEFLECVLDVKERGKARIPPHWMKGTN